MDPWDNIKVEFDVINVSISYAGCGTHELRVKLEIQPGAETALKAAIDKGKIEYDERQAQYDRSRTIPEKVPDPLPTMRETVDGT